MLRRMAKRAGIMKAIYPHGFRHNFRVRCVMLGLTDVEIASLMGQRTIRATQGYGRKMLAGQARSRYKELRG
jgi:site-specific recombinase XerD